MEQVKEYTHATFLAMLIAEDQHAAQARLDYITDMGVVIAGAFSSEGGELAEHIAQVNDAARGVRDHGS